MTDFIELCATPSSTHDDSAEDGGGFMGATLKSSGPRNLFKQGQFLPSSFMTIRLACHHDAVEEETRDVECDSALLLQLRINAPSIPDWQRKMEKAISDRAKHSPPLGSSGELKKGWALGSVKAWEAMGRRFQEKLKHSA